MIWIFGLGDRLDQGPRAVIRAGVEGLARCEWSGNGEEILIFSEHGVSDIRSRCEGERLMADDEHLGNRV